MSTAKAIKEKAGSVPNRATMKWRFRYGEHEKWEVWAVREDKPHRMRLAFPTARIYEDGKVESIPWTEERLMEACEYSLPNLRCCYGGNWHLQIRNVPAVGITQVHPRPHLPAMKAVPPLFKPNKWENLQPPNSLDIKPLATGKTGPTKIDWTSDDLKPVTREPGEGE